MLLPFLRLSLVGFSVFFLGLGLVGVVLDLYTSRFSSATLVEVFLAPTPIMALKAIDDRPPSAWPRASMAANTLTSTKFSHNN